MKFINLLQILFIGLKLTGYISWSWWLVMLPFIISFVLSFALGLSYCYAESIKNK